MKRRNERHFKMKSNCFVCHRFKQLISENELAAIVPLDQVELLEGALLLLGW